MKKFWRAFGIIVLDVMALPLDVIAIIIGLVSALYFKITAGISIVSFIKLCIDNTISNAKDLVHWVKTGKWN